jgi:hypothetical protein
MTVMTPEPIDPSAEVEREFQSGRGIDAPRFVFETPAKG